MGAMVTGPRHLLEKTLPDDSPNPFWDDANYADMIGIPTIPMPDGTVKFGPMKDYEKLDITKVIGLTQLGAEVHNYHCWIKVADLTTDVPAYLGSGKWEDWHDNLHVPTVIDGVNYVPGDSMGQHIKGTQIAQLVADGFEVFSLPQIQALLPDDGPQG